jgi:hypothetical protein
MSEEGGGGGWYTTGKITQLLPTLIRSISSIPHLRTLKRAKNGALAALCIGVPDV